MEKLLRKIEQILKNNSAQLYQGFAIGNLKKNSISVTLDNGGIVECIALNKVFRENRVNVIYDGKGNYYTFSLASDRRIVKTTDTYISTRKREVIRRPEFINILSISNSIAEKLPDSTTILTKNNGDPIIFPIGISRANTIFSITDIETNFTVEIARDTFIRSYNNPTDRLVLEYNEGLTQQQRINGEEVSSPSQTEASNLFFAGLGNDAPQVSRKNVIVYIDSGRIFAFIRTGLFVPATNPLDPDFGQIANLATSVARQLEIVEIVKTPTPLSIRSYGLFNYPDPIPLIPELQSTKYVKNLTNYSLIYASAVNIPDYIGSINEVFDLLDTNQLIDFFKEDFYSKTTFDNNTYFRLFPGNTNPISQNFASYTNFLNRIVEILRGQRPIEFIKAASSFPGNPRFTVISLSDIEEIVSFLIKPKSNLDTEAIPFFANYDDTFLHTGAGGRDEDGNLTDPLGLEIPYGELDIGSFIDFILSVDGIYAEV